MEGPSQETHLALDVLESLRLLCRIVQAEAARSARDRLSLPQTALLCPEPLSDGPDALIPLDWARSACLHAALRSHIPARLPAARSESPRFWKPLQPSDLAALASGSPGHRMQTARTHIFVVLNACWPISLLLRAPRFLTTRTLYYLSTFIFTNHYTQTYLRCFF